MSIISDFDQSHISAILHARIHAHHANMTGEEMLPVLRDVINACAPVILPYIPDDRAEAEVWCDQVQRELLNACRAIALSYNQ